MVVLCVSLPGTLNMIAPRFSSLQTSTVSLGDEAVVVVSLLGDSLDVLVVSPFRPVFEVALP